jgi:hypothetical protein
MRFMMAFKCSNLVISRGCYKLRERRKFNGEAGKNKLIKEEILFQNPYCFQDLKLVP